MTEQQGGHERLNGYRLADLDHALDHCGTALQGLRKGRLLLSGGTGFIGQWLTAALVRANQRDGLELSLYIPTRSAKAFALRCPELAGASRVHLVEGDVRSVALGGVRLTHVIHAAADTSVAADRQAFELADVIVEGTRHMLEQARQNGAEHFLFLSSGAVYGGQEGIVHVAETDRLACDPLDRRSVYAESKRYAEMLCGLFASEYGVSAKIARCFAFVGPGLPLDQHFAIGNFIRDAIQDRDIVIKSDGSPERSYLYAGDLVAWLLRALVMGEKGRAYHIGSDQAYSLADLAFIVRDVIGGAGQVVIEGKPQPAAFRSRYVPSVMRARTELGCDVWTSLPDAIVATADWARLR